MFVLHVQQTPKPFAHEPELEPPLFEHSDLKYKPAMYSLYSIENLTS